MRVHKIVTALSGLCAGLIAPRSTVARCAALSLALLGLLCSGPGAEPRASFAQPPLSSFLYLPLVANGSVAGPRSRSTYAYYYLWWSYQHWHDKLGPNFPYAMNPLPLPARLDDQGCGAVSLYAGNQLTDVPGTLWTQDDPALLEQDVRNAANSGLAGFIVNWAGTGEPGQTRAGSAFNRRLDSLIEAVHNVHAEAIPFHLWISYKASSVLLTLDHIRNDLTYLRQTYANDAAWDRRYSSRPMLVWQGSRKYGIDTVRTVSEEFRQNFFLIGDENWNTWGDGRAAYLDGDTTYWSTQDPYGNVSSFDRLRQLSEMVRSSGPNADGSAKLWFAPLAPGYDSELLGGTTCVPRNDGETMRLLREGNARSEPDGWAFISWNEIAEGSYIVPLQRWGTFYADTLRSLIR